MGLFDRFTTPKWQHEDSNVRLKAVDKLDLYNSLEALKYIVENDPDDRVRRRANLKLAHIVCYTCEVNHNAQAFEIINDDVALAQVVLNSSSFRRKAVFRIKDDSILFDLLTNPKCTIYPNVFVAIAEKTNDENCLIVILKQLEGSDYPEHCDSRQKAVKKISDVSVLEDVAKNDVDESVRLEAIKRLDDMRLINENKKETITKDKALDVCVDELIILYKQKPEGFLIDSADAQPVRDIGKKLNDAGGFDYMLEAHEMFSAKVNILGAARNLEMIWDGIGSWKG